MKKITPEDIRQHKLTGKWRLLERLSDTTNKQAEKTANVPLRPALGGGTRLMLAIEHRLSDDVDLFISDPQWLGYLTPRLNDAIEEKVKNYHEGATSLKLELAEGEIDYIISTPLLGLPNESSPDSIYELEPVAEVLAKKLFYRGATLTPRDLFDWRMIEMHVPQEDLHLEKMAHVLRDKLAGIAQALDALSQLDPNHPRWSSIRTPYPLDLLETVHWAQERVTHYQALAEAYNEPSPDSDSFPSP